MLRDYLVLKKIITHHSSLNFRHSSLLTHHLKYHNFVNPTIWHTIFSFSSLKYFYFCGIHRLSTTSSSQLPYLCVSSLPINTFIFSITLPQSLDTWFSLPLRPSILFLSSSPNSANLHLTQPRSPPAPNLQDHLRRAAATPISTLLLRPFPLFHFLLWGFVCIWRRNF